MSTIPQNPKLLKNLFEILTDQREISRQQRVYARIELLVLAELFTFGRHTVTQNLMSGRRLDYMVLDIQRGTV